MVKPTVYYYSGAHADGYINGSFSRAQSTGHNNDARARIPRSRALKCLIRTLSLCCTSSRLVNVAGNYKDAFDIYNICYLFPFSRI